MVARAMIEHCRSVGDDVRAFTRQDLDISDPAAVFEALSAERPDVVYNCAAYTNVDGAESDRHGAVQANAAGVEYLAAACRLLDSRFVTISTDYVFDGQNTGFYTQRDTPNPLGIYGKTKLDGEVRARDTYARTIIVRSGWIYGRGGTNFLSVVPQLLAKGAITAINDAFGTPTFSGDLVRRMRELAELDLPGVYHITNSGDGTTYAGFAEKVCELSGLETSLVKRISDRDLNRPAPRPASSKLACLLSERLGLEPMPQWEKALARFLASERSSHVSN